MPQGGNLNHGVTNVVTTQLGVVPRYPENDNIGTSSEACNTFSNANPPNISIIDPPEEGKLVRVGNMLQIVPER